MLPGRRGNQSTIRRGVATGSGREALDHPAAGLAAVPEAVVHPVHPAVPELEDLRHNPVPAPELRHRDLRSLWPACRQLGMAVLQLEPRGREWKYGWLSAADSGVTVPSMITCR